MIQRFDFLLRRMIYYSIAEISLALGRLPWLSPELSFLMQ
jgi:hypothetical protein